MIVITKYIIQNDGFYYDQKNWIALKQLITEKTQWDVFYADKVNNTCTLLI